MAEPVTIFDPSSTPARNPSPAAPVQRDSRVGDARIADGVRSDPPMSEPQRRYKADFDALTKADPWRDPNVVITKNPDGSLQVRPRTGAGQQGAAPGTGEQPQPQPEQPRGLIPPASVEGDKLRVGSYELSQADIARLFEAKGIEESRKATVPASADLYEIKVPADLKLPDGIEWSFRVDDPVQGPILQRARDIAAANGMSQDAFSQMLGLHVANQVQEMQVINRAKAAEVAKLGTLGSVRVDALTTFLRGAIGDEHAKHISNNLWTERQVVALERLMEKYVNGGVGGGSPGAHRDGGHRENRLSDSDYQKLSMHERIEYAKRFDQRQFQNGG